MSSLPSPAYAAVLFADRHASVGLLERLTSAKRITGASFEVSVGRLSGLLVAAAVPVEQPADFDRVVAAMRDAYRPQVVIGAGFSRAAPHGPAGGAAILGTRIVGDKGIAFQLSAGEFTDDRFLLTGSLAGHASQRQSPDCLAANDWCLAFVAACAKIDQPATVVTVVNQDDDQSISNEAADVLVDQPPARRAGAFLRALWRRPSSVMELARQKTQGWEHQETLAGAVSAVIDASAR